eukprot:9790038-Alexandrium_andersonii.AAC.1
MQRACERRRAGAAPVPMRAPPTCMQAVLGSKLCAGRAYSFTPLIGASLPRAGLPAHRTDPFGPRSQPVVPQPAAGGTGGRLMRKATQRT